MNSLGHKMPKALLCKVHELHDKNKKLFHTTHHKKLETFRRKNLDTFADEILFKSLDFGIRKIVPNLRLRKCREERSFL